MTKLHLWIFWWLQTVNFNVKTVPKFQMTNANVISHWKISFYFCDFLTVVKFTLRAGCPCKQALVYRCLLIWIQAKCVCGFFSLCKYTFAPRVIRKRMIGGVSRTWSINDELRLPPPPPTRLFRTQTRGGNSKYHCK